MSSSSSTDKSSSPDFSLLCDGSSTLRKIFYTVRTKQYCFQPLLCINFVPVYAFIGIKDVHHTIKANCCNVWKRRVARNFRSDWSCA
ncbi:hypothetical protein Plhal304r1_c012g0047901 [Plasmopara halstedii]